MYVNCSLITSSPCMALAVLLLAVSRPFEAAPVGATIEGRRRFATGTVSTYRRGHAATAWQAARDAHSANLDKKVHKPQYWTLAIASVKKQNMLGIRIH